MTQDRVTTVGTGVDGSVRRIAMTYEVRGMREILTSYDHPDVGSGNVVNEVQFAYNDFRQLITDYQAHGGAVNTSTTPKVEYGYANGAVNTVRPTTLTYPDGRVLTYDYGTANGIDDCASRVASLVDDDGSGTHLVDYMYLGMGRSVKSVNAPFGRGFVVADFTQPDTKWTLVDISDTNDPETGDIYSGLDRFGRIKDNRWYDYGSSSDVDRIKYGYDRSSNRIWRQNVVADALSEPFDELYDYDGVNRLKEMSRGTLNAPKDGITNKSLAECWSLDATGNWRKYLKDTNGDGAWDLNQSRTANEVNEITEIMETVGASWATPAYNRAGNMTTIPQPIDLTNSYAATYDAWDWLVKLEDGSETVAEYAYDGAKRRTVVRSYASGSLDEIRHYYFTDPTKWQIIEERIDSSGDAARQHVWGLRYIDDLVLRDRDTTGNGTLDERLYAMQDANWNVTTLADTAGDVQERFAYQAYGESLELDPDFTSYSGSDLEWITRFTGQELDLETGLQINRNRYLHPQFGAWLTRDSEGYLDGMNLYRSPIKPDPSGNITIKNAECCDTDGSGANLLLDLTNTACERITKTYRFLRKYHKELKEEFNNPNLPIESVVHSKDYHVIVDNFRQAAACCKNGNLSYDCGTNDPEDHCNTSSTNPSFYTNIVLGIGLVTSSMRVCSAFFTGKESVQINEIAHEIGRYCGNQSQNDSYWGPAWNVVVWDKLINLVNDQPLNTDAIIERAEDDPEGPLEPRPKLPIYCFIKGTLVSTMSGMKAIENIKPGDRVWSFSSETASWNLSVVERCHEAVVPGEFVTIRINGGDVTCTSSHPFWVVEQENDLSKQYIPTDVLPIDGHWEKAGSLRSGDVVISRLYGMCEIADVTTNQTELTVYNISLESNRNYLVGDHEILVHNK